MASLRLVNAAQKESIVINVRDVFEFSTLNEMASAAQQFDLVSHDIEGKTNETGHKIFEIIKRKYLIHFS